MSAAQCLWNRHEGELSSELTLETVDHLLDCIPEGLEVKHCTLMLENTLIPSILTLCPEAIQAVALWVQKTAR